MDVSTIDQQYVKLTISDVIIPNAYELNIQPRKIFGVSFSPQCIKTPSDIFDATSPKYYSQLPTNYFLIHTLEWQNEQNRVPLYKPYCFKVNTIQVATSFVSTIRSKANLTKSNGTQKLFKVFINPFGGRKKAAQIFKKVVEPMYKLADIKINVHLSEYAGHVPDILKEADIHMYDGIITVSGDGLFHEVIDSLMNRKDWNSARKIPIGAIGAGTSRAFNKNTDTVDTRCATFATIKGITKPMDLFSTFQRGRVTFSHLALFWGLIADIDLESEKIRWAGELRITIWAIIRILFVREYTGSIFYLPSNESISSSSTSSLIIPGYVGPALKHADADYHSWAGCLPSRTFTMVQLCNLPWISNDMLMSRECRLSNGNLDLIWASRLSTMDLLPLFLNSKNAAHLHNIKVQRASIKAFVLEPGSRVGSGGYTTKESPETSRESELPLASSSAEKSGFISLSGESIPLEPIRIEIHEKMMNVFTPYWLSEPVL